MAKTYDPACAVLAKHFLQDRPLATPEEIASLARSIQQAIEEWFADNPLPEEE
jgi:hypothetical protein